MITNFKNYKTYFFALSFSLMSFYEVAAQQVAVTENGEEVILYEDGTWKYKDTKSSWTTSLDTVIRTKPAKSAFLVKGSRFPYGVWVNAKEWKFKKTETGNESPSELSFQLIGEEAHALIIAERLHFSLNELREIAVANATKAAPDIQVVHEDIRKINGVTVRCLQMNGTVRGLKITYLGYYYSTEKGTVQFITFTGQNLFKEYKQRMEALLDGFVILE